MTRAPRYGIRAIEFANGEPCPHAGQWLKDFNFEAFDGIGYGEFTKDADIAMRFRTRGAAFDFWRRQSRVCPIREDGKPNRPLTAVTVQIEQLS